MQNKLFVRNLSYNTEDCDLTALFSSYGRVTSAKVAIHRDTGKKRGFGFVEMGSEQSADDAIRALEGSNFDGRTIYVTHSEQRSARTTHSSW